MANWENNIGLLILLISLFGYISNYLNWRFLNTKIIRYSYIVGAMVHEMSHAFFCLLTGAKIKQIKIFSRRPQVIHTKSKLGIVGQVLISLAPIIGGLLFLFVIDYFVLQQSFSWERSTGYENVLAWLSVVDLLSWRNLIALFVILNAGSMLGPSGQDLKNIWPAVLAFLFWHNQTIAFILWLALSIILLNILLQLSVITLKAIVRLLLSIFAVKD